MYLSSACSIVAPLPRHTRRPPTRRRPGHVSNFRATARKANHIYFARTLGAATWGAELAVGEGRGRIYIVEPTGPIEDDPNLTNKKFRGNPTKSFRSRDPLRITGEITDWQGHAPGAIQAMKRRARTAQAARRRGDRRDRRLIETSCLRAAKPCTQCGSQVL
ncbi:MAG: NAD(+)--rifampin ADP-ribosyltransferase [Myxococcota bacterium]|nr:NAD(+)--rifampin ADP-ribosyltransferase [Myxococcota bacterium]